MSTALFQSTAPTISENTTGWKNDTKDDPFSMEVILGLETLTIAVMVVIVLTIASMVVYGTKTRRWWKRPSSSSLSSGSIFVLCTLAITFCLSFPIATVVCFQYSSLAISCERMADITTSAYIGSSYLIYLFLWRYQRIIYKHSYVQPSIKPWVNWLSRFYCILTTLSAVGLIIFYIYPMSFKEATGGCALNMDSADSIIPPNYRYALVIPMAVINFSVIILFIYPAARVKFDIEVENEEPDATRRSSLRQRYPTLSYVQKWAHSVAGNYQNTITSPIELAVRRGVTSCSIIVVIDLVFSLVAQLAIPLGSPIVIAMSIYNVALLLKIYAIIFTLSFGFAALKVFIPHCRKPKARRGQSMKRGSGADTELMNASRPSV